MGLFGQLMVCMAAVLSGVGGALVLNGNHNPKALDSGKKLLHASAAASAAALLVLVFLLLCHDYRMSYVRTHADRSMSMGYLITAIWGGQQGSLLVWAALQTFFTSAVASVTFSKNRNLVPVALFFLAATQIFFLGLVLFHSNPFDQLGTVASTGIGMNPLLRNPYMVIHPPTLYLGFVGFSVPMAFAIAALIEGKGAENWLGEIRLFVIFAWALLGVGNILGMVWAYQELNWGGYWGWDPVENASFMPWLTGTALVHSALMLKTRKAFSSWCLTLTWLTFVLVVFGTFLTRSGVIQSVHSFSGATTGPYLLGFIAVVTVLFLGLLAKRFKSLIAEKTIESWLSREGFFYISNVVFVLSAVFVWLATMTPLFTELFKGEKAAVTPEFFNLWMVPFGLAILALIGLCLMFSGQKKTADWAKPALIPVLVGIVIAAAVAWTRTEGGMAGVPWKAAVGSGIVGFVSFFVLGELKKIIGRRGKSDKAKASLRKRLGAQLVHLSVVLLFVGFTGSAYTEEKMANLSPGQTMGIGSYSLTFLSLREDNTFKRHALLADLQISKDGKILGIISPSRHTYHSHPNKPTNEVDIRTSLLEDLYVILDNADPRSGRAIIRALVNPLVAWIWIGGILMILGALVAFWPRNLFEVLETAGVKRQKFILRGALTTGIIAVAFVAGTIGDAVTSTTALIGVSLTGVVFLVGDGLLRLASARRVR